MKTLVLGANGQLGWELQRTCPAGIHLALCDFPRVDFTTSDSIQQCIQAAAPDCIINAAAYTAVDKAETEPDLAERINHLAVRELAGLCRRHRIHLVHISTDFVFSGKNHKPWLPEDTPYPISEYGRTKLRGEQAVLETLDTPLIIRTAWLYSAHGANFVKTMLRLMKEKPALTVIDEQIGTPTWARGLADVVWQAAGKSLSGIFHWTDAGVASWYDFAVAIQELSLDLGLIKTPVPIQPVPAAAFPTPAQRPMYSVLDKTATLQALDVPPVHWRTQLKAMLTETLGVRS
ncbi:MAG: dTDP-4-dehydrorhamnose reductase [Desulfotignum sp.]|jgi:dTDP-4-dehydrorhamnose reductase|nr:dTDP-4-dehydrorhamnose reductase [Desulfotignum sp.]